MSRQNLPAEGCKATKEGLIDDGFGVTKDCPICKEDHNVLCRVSNHPNRQQGGDGKFQPSRKRAKSISDQRKQIEDQCPDLISDYDCKVQELLEVQKSHIKVDNELRENKEQLSRLRSLSKSFIATGSTSTERSFFEMYIKTFEANQWQLVSYLHQFIRGSVVEYYSYLDDNVSDVQLEQMKAHINGGETSIPEQYEGSVRALQLLRSIRDHRKESEKKIVLLKYVIEDPTFTIVDSLPYCSKVDVGAVKDAFGGLYHKLCNAVHQSDARFSGEDDFLLPRATDAFTVAEVYAMASIVKASGFNPVYPAGDDNVI